MVLALNGKSFTENEREIDGFGWGGRKEEEVNEKGCETNQS